jgi:hypothetical protein
VPLNVRRPCIATKFSTAVNTRGVRFTRTALESDS